jgi:hypothetical protein
MQARKIIAESTCCEESRRAIGLAFDEGWRIIGPYFSDDASEVEAVRLQLAQEILSQSSSHIGDPEELSNAALAALGWLPRERPFTRNAPVALKKVA